MIPFSTIAIPHKDILEGRFTMDIFAADLWEVFKGRAPEEYQDPVVFFRKTHVTDGLKNLLEVAEKRIEGKGGDPVIQLQTPFGGGKTHALIALYHKANEWKKVNTIVICGDKLGVGEGELMLWEEMESQLSGNVKILKGRTSPGGDKLRGLFQVHQPLIILMDEVLQYTTKASGVKVGDSSLASQVLAFMQELTGTVKTLDKTLLVLALPSSALEHYDESAEKLFVQLQKIVGRMEKIYEPVHDEEISSVIRKRLFSSIDEKEARDVIEKFLDYAEKEDMLPEGVEKASYRENFIRSYPFQPEVIDILYKRWGSFPGFHRTRGVLRLLSLVIYSLSKSKNSFIRLADFDLGNDEIKRELIKYIGQEYAGIIAQDITSKDAGAKKVDKALGDTYLPFSFGTKVATAVFLYSFSGGPEKGAALNEIKLSSAEMHAPSSIVVEAVEKLKGRLFYLWSKAGKYLFTNQPNLNLVLLTKMEGIGDDELEAEEKNLLAVNLKKEKFDLYLWPENSRDVPDTKRLKLVVQKNQDEKRCREFLANCGERPRIYPNTLIFLCAADSERPNYEDFIKKKIAWQLIDRDRTLRLTPEQREDVRKEIKEGESKARDNTRDLYRILLIPSPDGLKEIDLGAHTFGVELTIDREIYDRLRGDEILEKLSPLSLRERYLKGKDYVETKNILESFYKTPGEIRITSDEVLKNCVSEGVMQGLFGLGDLENGKPVCRRFREECSPELVEGEILIRAELCKPKVEISEEELQSYVDQIRQAKTLPLIREAMEGIPFDRLTPEQEGKLEKLAEERKSEIEGKAPKKDRYGVINLKLSVPPGRLSDIVRIVNYIRTKFNQVDIKVEISSKEGEITVSEYEDKIKEAISLAKVSVEEERNE